MAPIFAAPMRFIVNPPTPLRGAPLYRRAMYFRAHPKRLTFGYNLEVDVKDKLAKRRAHLHHPGGPPVFGYAGADSSVSAWHPPRLCVSAAHVMCFGPAAPLVSRLCSARRRFAHRCGSQIGQGVYALLPDIVLLTVPNRLRSGYHRLNISGLWPMSLKIPNRYARRACASGLRDATVHSVRTR